MPSAPSAPAGRGIIIRAAVLEPIALALWWFVLRGASLWLLRVAAYVPLGLLIAPGGLPPVRVDPASGEWVFNVAVNATGTNLQTGQQQFVESVEFVAPPDNVAFFASGWFSYLALAFAAGPYSKLLAKRAAKGIATQTCVNVLSLAAYGYINGYGSVVRTAGGETLAMWWINYAYHIIYLVLPFAGPFLVAALFHPEWRELFWAGAGQAPASKERARAKPRR